MKMVSMKLPPPKKGDTNDQAMGGCSPDSDEMYPYGLRVSLQDEQLTALGMKELPKVGSAVTITATANVVSVGSDQDRDGSVDRSVSLQITDMSLDSQKPNAADKLYGGGSKKQATTPGPS